MPAFILFALFIGVPVAEIGLFIEVGGWIGLWPTLVTVVLTALIGTALLRAQGFG
ncbi:MAG: FxsA family protein, partial [Alphaproteobacteria bacterium]